MPSMSYYLCKSEFSWSRWYYSSLEFRLTLFCRLLCLQRHLHLDLWSLSYNLKTGLKIYSEPLFPLQQHIFPSDIFWQRLSIYFSQFWMFKVNVFYCIWPLNNPLSFLFCAGSLCLALFAQIQKICIPMCIASLQSLDLPKHKFKSALS